MSRNSAKIGLGCMCLSHAYGKPPGPEEEEGIALIRRAYELGVRHFDTAILYGFGRNEILVGEAVKPFRNEITLASKCGLTTAGPDIKRQIDGQPETIRQSCEDSLKRLQSDVIDLYYLHRLDPAVPVEDSVGALKDLVVAGKVREIGLSEVSAETLRRAHAVHPIAALQSEYSLWTRNAEIAVLDVCAELGIDFVAFSPLGRGFLSGSLGTVPEFPEGDLRRNMPRFQAPHYQANLSLLATFKGIADEQGCSPSQLAIAWLLHRGDRIIPIPGTTRLDHLQENLGASSITLDADCLARLDQQFSPERISGARYGTKTQAEIDTERFLFETFPI